MLADLTFWDKELEAAMEAQLRAEHGPVAARFAAFRCLLLLAVTLRCGGQQRRASCAARTTAALQGLQTCSELCLADQKGHLGDTLYLLYSLAPRPANPPHVDVHPLFRLFPGVPDSSNRDDAYTGFCGSAGIRLEIGPCACLRAR